MKFAKSYCMKVSGLVTGEIAADNININVSSRCVDENIVTLE